MYAFISPFALGSHRRQILRIPIFHLLLLLLLTTLLSPLSLFLLSISLHPQLRRIFTHFSSFISHALQITSSQVTNSPTRASPVTSLSHLSFRTCDFVTWRRDTQAPVDTCSAWVECRRRKLETAVNQSHVKETRATLTATPPAAVITATAAATTTTTTVARAKSWVRKWRGHFPCPRLKWATFT